MLPPNVRRNRQAGSTPTARERDSSRSASSSSTLTSGLPRPISDDGGGKREGGGNAEWICQFVGLSGDQDPFVLRHCSFNALNCYKADEWAILRIKGDTEVPLHFTVSSYTFQ